ncbi:UNKNOWN [Stylonychia lemnae]|uniref:Transmembrane protein n=1 Tax=Stylonychia lemnae TaxID=5949 RepID=A0A078BCA9_STYLE|nr:UNKNOWN [Stylonychia lemnae]|eukprot:CDW91233.1 UNKNOWN [Stylonychia lemnae]
MRTLKIQDEVATACTIASLLISGYQIGCHLANYHEPSLQLYVIRILLMIPVYSTATWLSVMIPKETLLFNTMRDIYEAYVLYIFMKLLIQFLGGENSLIVHLEFKVNTSYDKFVFREELDNHGLLMAILAIVFDKYGIYNEGHFEFRAGYLYLSIINNISISLSLYCLVLFYMATEERLKPFNPFAKFLCIKAILFFSFWQACAFTISLKMNLFDRDFSQLAQSLIISVEMVFASIAQAFAFNYKSFVDHGKKRQNVFKTIGYVLNVKDVISDAHNTFIKDNNKDSEQETIMEDVLKDKAFNWTDEEETPNPLDKSPGSGEEVNNPYQISSKSMTTQNKKIKKQKYKQSQLGSSNSSSATATTTIQQHLSQIKNKNTTKSAEKGYSQLKSNQPHQTTVHSGVQYTKHKNSENEEFDTDSYDEDEDEEFSGGEDLIEIRIASNSDHCTIDNKEQDLKEHQLDLEKKSNQNSGKKPHAQKIIQV